MEDAHLTTQISFPNIHAERGTIDAVLYAVCDGHGHQSAGSHPYKASNFVILSLQEALVKVFSELNTVELTPHIVRDALKSTVKHISDAYNYYYCSTYGALTLENGTRQDGTTLIACLIIGKDLWIINVGDSEACLVYPDQTILLSEKAKLSIPRYVQKIRQLGGEVLQTGDGPRVQGHLLSEETPRGFLNMAKSIGDQWIPGIDQRPKITHRTLEGDGYILVYCDGFSDASSTYEAGQSIASMAARGFAPNDIAQNLVYSAVRLRGSWDNVSLIVAKLPFMEESKATWLSTLSIYFPLKTDLDLDQYPSDDEDHELHDDSSDFSITSSDEDNF